jgi:hypothetical protein
MVTKWATPTRTLSSKGTAVETTLSTIGKSTSLDAFRGGSENAQYSVVDFQKRGTAFYAQAWL